jgi:hypothetical protein
MNKVFCFLVLFPFILNAQNNEEMKVTLLNKNKEFLLDIENPNLILDSNHIIVANQFKNDFLSHIDTTSTINGILSFEINKEIIYVYVLAIHCSWIPAEYPYFYYFRGDNKYQVYFGSDKVREKYNKILFFY